MEERAMDVTDVDQAAVIERGEEPFDRVTRLANAARKAIVEHPEYREDHDKIMIGIDDPDGDDGRGRGGFFAAGYNSVAELVGNLFDHAKATLQSTGVATITYEKQGEDGMVARIVFAQEYLAERDDIMALVLVPLSPPWKRQEDEGDDTNTGMYL